MADLKRGGLRLVDTFVFAVPRQTMKIQVPARFIQKLWLNITGEITISAVVTPGRLHTDGAAQLGGLFELLQDGKTLKFGSLASFLRISQKYDGTLGMNNGLISGAAGVYPFQCVVPIFFQAPASVSPVDTLIDGRNVETMTANLTWNTLASLFIGNTSTLAFSVAPTCEVYMEDTEPFTTQGPFWSLREIETTFANIVANPQTRMSVPFQPGAIMRSMQLRAIDGADLSDELINALSLRINGEEIPINTVEDDIFQAQSMHAFGSPSDPQGYYHMELAENGRVAMTGLGAKLSGQAVNDVDVIANTAAPVGAGSIVIHTMEHVPPGAL